MIVFPKFHQVPFSKLLSFYRRDNFSLVGEYDGSAPIMDQKISTFEIGEVKGMVDGSSQKVKVKVRINLNGIFVVAGASLIEKVEVEEEVPMEMDAKGEEKKEAGANTDETMDSNGNDDAAKEEAKGEGKSKQESEGVESPSAQKAEKRRRTVNKTIDLPVTSIAAGSLPRDKLEKLTEMELKLSNQDRVETNRYVLMQTVDTFYSNSKPKQLK